MGSSPIVSTEELGGPRVLNVAALQPELLRERPFRWAWIPDLIRPDHARALRESFPHEDFWLNEGDDGEKTYRFRIRPFLTQDAAQVAPLAPLAPAWQHVARALAAPAFRAAVGRMIGCDLDECGVEADFFRLGACDWIGPHRDLPSKLASIVVYLNDDGWEPSDGGCLRILGSKNESRPIAELAPTSGSAALIVRSSRSWHSVTPLHSRVRGDRVSFQVIFWRPGRVSSNWTVDEASGTVSAGRRVDNGPLRRRIATRFRIGRS